MGRPQRIEFPGAIYHIAARGNNRQEIVFSNEDRRELLDLFSRATSRFHLEIFAFCLMTNHYHLFLRTPESNLATAMKWLNGIYSSRLNRRRQRAGHLFQGHYQSILVKNEAHWLHLSMYIHLNPVRAGIVEDPGEYEWSSFRDYTRAQSRFSWLHPEEVLEQYGVTDTARRRHYRETCLKLAGAEPKVWEQIRNPAALGIRDAAEILPGKESRASRLRASPSLSHKSVSDTDPADPDRKINFEVELGWVARAFKVETKLLRIRSRNFPARLAAYYHLVEHCGAKTADAAAEMGITGSGVSRGRHRIQRMMAEDRELRRKVNSLKS